ncbi:hypothetical protein L798_01540 [Zootermopsis nevadensis]|uniref:Uncharacterized protein n=1 Tax=Zootermopsis nevadensis TaxID=136037 RepID=A0A067QVU6_ZOONE|nr:hypothetical protein L798_01540 [Zootermopsis nevadensis]
MPEFISSSKPHPSYWYRVQFGITGFEFLIAAHTNSRKDRLQE